MRKEDRELDFKGRQLDDILNWAKEVKRELLLPRGLPTISDYDLKVALESLAVGNDWAVMVAQTFGADFQDTVRRATKALDDYTGEQTDAHRSALMESLNNLLEAVYKTKTEQKL